MTQFALICNVDAYEGRPVWQFYPNISAVTGEAVIKEPEPRYISMLTGEAVGPGTPHRLGKPGSGVFYMVENDQLVAERVSFLAEPDETKWMSFVGIDTCSMLHEPQNAAALEALRKMVAPRE